MDDQCQSIVNMLLHGIIPSYKPSRFSPRLKIRASQNKHFHGVLDERRRRFLLSLIVFFFAFPFPEPIFLVSLPVVLLNTRRHSFSSDPSSLSRLPPPRAWSVTAWNRQHFIQYHNALSASRPPYVPLTTQSLRLPSTQNQHKGARFSQ